MDDQELLKKLAQNVLLKSGMAPIPGLFYGKMGMVLFLMHYARYVNAELYEEYAGLLLDDIYSHLDIDLPINLENGLCGIGWGTEYLLQNKFVEGDRDEILADIDQRVMEREPMRVSDLSLGTGLSGIIEYALIRLRSGKPLEQRNLFDPAYLKSLKEAATKLSEHTDNASYRKRAALLITGMEHPDKIPARKVFDIIPWIAPENESLWQRPDGLSNGNAGAGLKMIVG